MCIAVSKFEEFRVKTQNLHYRPEETRHKRNNSLMVSFLQRQHTNGELGLTSSALHWVVDSSWGPVVSSEAFSRNVFQLKKPLKII